MAKEAVSIIEEINRIDDPTGRKLHCQTMSVHKYESATGFQFSEDYKEFLKNVSNACRIFISAYFKRGNG